MNPPEVESEIRRLLERLEEATYEMGSLAEAAGHAEVRAKVAYARAYLASDGPVSTREQLAVVASETDLLGRRIAEAKVTAQRELLSTIRTQVDGLRTIAANMRGLT